MSSKPMFFQADDSRFNPRSSTLSFLKPKFRLNLNITCLPFNGDYSINNSTTKEGSRQAGGWLQIRKSKP